MTWYTVVVVFCIVSVLSKCESVSNSDNESQLSKYHRQNRILKLICRDDTTLVVGIENEFGEAQATEKIGETYMVTINNKDESKIPPKSVYLVRKPYAIIKNLKSSTSYNISANLLNEHYQYTARNLFMEFETLEVDYIPGNITNIYTEDFTLSTDGKGVNVAILWDPSADRTCFYNLLFHSRDVNYETETFAVREFNQPEELYRHELKNLTFGMEYAIGIQALNTKNPTLQGEIWWHVITTPDCWEWLKDNVTCAPYHPENIDVAVDVVSVNIYNFNVTWDRPAKFPDYYAIDIIDYESGLRQVFNITNGTTNSVQITDVEIHGINFELFVTAHSAGGDSSTIYRGKIDHSIAYQPSANEYSTLQIVALITAPLFAAVVIVAVKLKLNQRAKSIRAQNRVSYFQELELKSPNDPKIYDNHIDMKDRLDQIYALQSDFNLDVDKKMELEPNLIQTLEIIGEGAFGCVRRAILMPEKRIIAVKMLKSGPSYADVKNFYGEIEVMKSVPSHPNIVGIIGHCTKNIFGLMLLTEYCSEGNLINFLRNIYDDQLMEENVDVVHSPASKFKSNQPDEFERFQNYEALRSQNPKGKYFTKEFNKDLTFTSTSRMSMVENPTYGFDLSASRMNMVENHGYDFDLSASRMCIVENHGYGFDIGNNQVENAITEIDLLSFAHQIAHGMDHLSENHVVHRDLACRNVLVFSDRKTVKISDFGLSRDIYQENLYKKSGSGMLPIKWLAIESMTHQVYSTQSDVWSFGVLLYEIVTKGAVPYPTVDTKDILNFLKDGKRMDRPNGCRADIYKLMLSCWNVVPNERPTFKIIIDKLVQIMDEMKATSML